MENGQNLKDHNYLFYQHP